MLNEVTATVPLEEAEKDTELYQWARGRRDHGKVCVCVPSQKK